MSPAPFSLAKWYLDCVTDQGQTAIFYCADIRWHAVRASYSSLLLSDGQTTTSRSAMTRSRLAADQQTISVNAPRLHFTGEWHAASSPIEHTVYSSPNGSIHWNCLQPASTVDLEVDGTQLTGAGYAECLTLTLPPWQLPLRCLRWGRFVSPQDALVWIDWQGAYETSIAFHNGTLCRPAFVSDTAIALENASLAIDKSSVLRAGRLGSTVLPGAPALRKIFPKALFGIEEQKWRSCGTLKTPQHDSQGWVIHEVVHWNA